ARAARSAAERVPEGAAHEVPRGVPEAAAHHRRRRPRGQVRRRCRGAQVDRGPRPGRDGGVKRGTTDYTDNTDKKRKQSRSLLIRVIRVIGGFFEALAIAAGVVVEEADPHVWALDVVQQVPR